MRFIIKAARLDKDTVERYRRFCIRSSGWHVVAEDARYRLNARERIIQISEAGYQ